MSDIKTVYRCSNCKGLNVQIKHWINPNTLTIDLSTDFNTADSFDCWCNDCKLNTDLETVEPEILNIDFSHYMEDCKLFIKEGLHSSAVRHYKYATKSGLEESKKAMNELKRTMIANNEI